MKDCGNGKHEECDTQQYGRHCERHSAYKLVDREGYVTYFSDHYTASTYARKYLKGAYTIARTYAPFGVIESGFNEKEGFHVSTL